MHVLLNDEETMLAHSVFGQAVELGATGTEALQHHDDRRLWQGLATSDVLSLGLSEDFGGFGTLTDAAIAAMALGRALAPVPYLGCAILPTQLLASTGGSLGLVDDLLSGARRVAVGIDPNTNELASESSARAIAWDCAGADAALVLDGDGSGRLVAVGLESLGQDLDLTRQSRRCALETRSLVVGLEDQTKGLTGSALTRWNALALAMVSADMAGVMDGALALAIEHVKTRHQFGVPIGTFQALQHLLAEQHVSLEGARATTLYAAWALDKRPEDAVSAAHTAKAYCSEHGKRLCEAVLQVHGGMGVTWECLAHVFLKRVLFDRAVLGDERHHLRAIAAMQRASGRKGDAGGL